MAAIYSVFTSPHHAPMPNHLPTLIVTPHGQPGTILYSYLHTEYNTVNYLLTPSPQGDLCVAKLFPPNRGRGGAGAGALSDPGHGRGAGAGAGGWKDNMVRCEASRDLRWTIENTGVRSPIYKIVNSDDTPLYQISKPNPNADFWTMFYFAYAGHQIPPRRVEFGRISKNAPEKGGGTRITITGKTEDEKKVWQTLGEGNEDCVEWVVACGCLNLLDEEILKAAERKVMGSGPASTSNMVEGGAGPGARGGGGGGPASSISSSSSHGLGPASSSPSTSRAGQQHQSQPIRAANGQQPQSRTNQGTGAMSQSRPPPTRSQSVDPARGGQLPPANGRPHPQQQQQQQQHRGDPNYHAQYATQQRLAPIQTDPRGSQRSGSTSPYAPHSAPPNQQIGYDPRRQAPPPHPHHLQNRGSAPGPQNGQRF